MEDLTGKITDIITVVASVLIAVQSIVIYLLPPEKAEKFNWIGKVLAVLSKTKSGLSPRKDAK